MSSIASNTIFFVLPLRGTAHGREEMIAALLAAALHACATTMLQQQRSACRCWEGDAVWLAFGPYQHEMATVTLVDSVASAHVSTVRHANGSVVSAPWQSVLRPADGQPCCNGVPSCVAGMAVDLHCTSASTCQAHGVITRTWPDGAISVYSDWQRNWITAAGSTVRLHASNQLCSCSAGDVVALLNGTFAVIRDAGAELLTLDGLGTVNASNVTMAGVPCSAWHPAARGNKQSCRFGVDTCQVAGQRCTRTAADSSDGLPPARCLSLMDQSSEAARLCADSSVNIGERRDSTLELQDAQACEQRALELPMHGDWCGNTINSTLHLAFQYSQQPIPALLVEFSRYKSLHNQVAHHSSLVRWCQPLVPTSVCRELFSAPVAHNSSSLTAPVDLCLELANVNCQNGLIIQRPALLATLRFSLCVGNVGCSSIRLFSITAWTFRQAPDTRGMCSKHLNGSVTLGYDQCDCYEDFPFMAGSERSTRAPTTLAALAPAVCLAAYQATRN